MSHSSGRVKFQDGLILHYEYNGTVDIVCNCLYELPEEVNENWRNQPHNTCDCGNDEPVEIATSYGGGFYWPGKACRHCKAITDGVGTGMDESLYDKEIDNLPVWWL